VLVGRQTLLILPQLWKKREQEKNREGCLRGSQGRGRGGRAVASGCVFETDRGGKAWRKRRRVLQVRERKGCGCQSPWRCMSNSSKKNIIRPKRTRRERVGPRRESVRTKNVCPLSSQFFGIPSRRLGGARRGRRSP